MEPAVAYLRTSTEQQQANSESLDQQLDEVKTYCEEKGYELVDVYRDVISGEERDRAGFFDLLAAIEAEEASVAVAYGVDRFGRNMRDHVVLCDRADDADVRLETTAGRRDHLETPEAWLNYMVKGVFSGYENRKRARDAQRGKRNRARDGYWVRGRPPTGYTTEGRSGRKLLVPTEAAPLVCRLFEDYVRGVTQRELAAWCREEHADVMPSSQDAVSKILRRPAYLGLVPWKGEWYEGRHEAIVPDGLYMQVQAIRRERARYFSSWGRG